MNHTSNKMNYAHFARDTGIGLVNAGCSGTGACSGGRDFRARDTGVASFLTALGGTSACPGGRYFPARNTGVVSVSATGSPIARPVGRDTSVNSSPAIGEPITRPRGRDFPPDFVTSTLSPALKLSPIIRLRARARARIHSPAPLRTRHDIAGHNPVS